MRRIADYAVFVAVAKAGTISEATRALGVSVASVSKYIARVEQDVGVRLLVRSSRGLRLTEEGQALYQDLDNLLSRMETVIRQAGESKVHPQGALRIKATAGLGQRRIAPLVSHFSSLYPALSVQLYLGDRDADMIGENLDVAITVGQPEGSDRIAKRLMHNPSLICASPEYLRHHPAPRDLEDLCHHECLILDCHGAYRDQWPIFDQQGRRHTLRVNGNLVTDNPETLREWLLDGYGLALKSQWDILEYLESGELVRVLPEYRPPDMDFFLVYPSLDFLPAKTRAFITFLRENIDNTALLNDIARRYRNH